MILKFLLVVGVIAFVYFVFIKKKPAVSHSKKGTQHKERKPSNELVECVECGIYCELDDTILSSNKYYCSKECVEKS
ncbi:PP0621 family protein [Sulfurimonas sp.]|uniref:PP0621 family protein n=1 Tax=Sulfurimonas sp. TaxID=2022749 RepID=UPI002AB09E0C|nr:PP0621 family protein [Sulfurimonas sp.]